MFWDISILIRLFCVFGLIKIDVFFIYVQFLYANLDNVSVLSTIQCYIHIYKFVFVCFVILF